MKLFYFQSQKNVVYNAYLSEINIDPQKVRKIEEIPFLPIEFFREFMVKTGKWEEDCIFESSGTTGQIPSKHYIRDVSFYDELSVKGFELQYGDINNYTFLALLPSYLERGASSLVHMVNNFIHRSGARFSGFYLNEYDKLFTHLNDLKKEKTNVMLVGVTFALLEFCENFELDFPDLLVLETGGMKGRRKEMVREEVHSIIKRGFSIEKVHSEYGMTELLSQAYSKGDGKFVCPPWMRVLIRETNDPFQWEKTGKSGGINIIDLANVHSCAFIETKDIGTKYEEGSFEVWGRLDNSEIRGCNLLVT